MSDTPSAAEQLNIYQALAAAQGEFPPIPKTQEGQAGQRRYMYADLATIIKTLQPVLTRYDLAVAQTFESYVDADQVVRTFLVTELRHGSDGSGAYIVSKLPMELHGLTMQQVGSQITYLRRYALTALLGVCADDDDDGAAVTGARSATPEAQEGRPSSETTRSEPPTGLIEESARKALWAEAQRLHGDFADVALQDLLRSLGVKRSTQIKARDYTRAAEIISKWKTPEEPPA